MVVDKVQPTMSHFHVSWLARGFIPQIFDPGDIPRSKLLTPTLLSVGPHAYVFTYTTTQGPCWSLPVTLSYFVGLMYDTK